MGVFRQFKNMAGVVNEMPEMMRQAQQLQTHAEQARMAAGPAAGGGFGAVPQPADPALGDPRLAPIEGVTLQRYAQVSKVCAKRGLDESGLAAHVTSLGYDPEAWRRAAEGWNARFQGDMQLATYFGRLYTDAEG